MAGGAGVEGQGLVDAGPHGADILGPFGQGGGDVQLGERLGGHLDRLGEGGGLGAPVLEGRDLHGQGSLGRLGDAGVQIGQLDGGEPHLVGQGLAVDEGGIERRLEQRVGLAGRGLDEIAEHAVVANLQRHAAFLHQAGLQRRDHPAAVIAQGAGLVELGPHAGGHEAAVASQGRQVGPQADLQLGQQARQAVLQRRGQGLQRGFQLGGRRRQRVARPADHAGQLLAGLQAVLEAAQVARTAPAQGQARKRSGHVAGPLQHLAQALAQGPVVDEPFHGVQAGVDGGRIQQRAGQARGQHPRAASGHRAVDRRQQRAIAVAALGAVNLQAGAGGRVDGHDVGLGGAARGAKGRQLARLGHFQVGGDQAQGADLGAGETTEAVQGVDAVQALDPRLRRLGLRQRRGHGLDQPAADPQGLGQVVVGQQAVGDQGLGRRERRQDGPHGALGDQEALDLARGQLHGRHGRLAGPHGHGGQAVGAARVQQAVLGQGAGRDHPDDVTADHRLGAALLGLGRVFHLLADGDLEAQADQLGQVGFRRVLRHPGHRDRLAVVVTPEGLRDAEGGGGLVGVVEEQLVEVAHPEEDHRVRMPRLHLEELLHHRRRASGVIGLDGSGGGGVHPSGNYRASRPALRGVKKRTQGFWGRVREARALGKAAPACLRAASCRSAFSCRSRRRC